MLLPPREIGALLTLDENIDAVEQVFTSYAEGKALPPGIMGFHSREGGFHIKAARLKWGRTDCAAKSNGSFLQNMSCKRSSFLMAPGRGCRTWPSRPSFTRTL